MLSPDDWKGTTEQLDQFKTYSQAQSLEGREPEVPMTYIGSEQLELSPYWPVEQMTAAIRGKQRELVGRFPAGRFVLVDAPHYMEPAIPERIAQEVKRVSDAS